MHFLCLWLGGTASSEGRFADSEAVGSVTGRENRQLLIVFIVAFSKNLNLLIIERKWFPPKAVILHFRKKLRSYWPIFYYLLSKQMEL